MESGATLGPYRIDRELGSGGMGKVYAATGPDGVVALKVVHPHLLEQPGFFKRFLREADIGRSVRHENVVRTLDCDQLVCGGQANAYLVMEYVEGQTLADLQLELDKVPEELCRHIAREICKGLAAVHDAGVVHRDLKPDNVLITPDHVVKVMDLGVAQLADEQLRLSQSGAFVGSVEYAAPEQFGGDVDHRCDLHALGVLLYEIACGQHPYRADSFPVVMSRIRDAAPRRLGDVNPQLSAFFEEVVHTLLAKDADERFASAEELLDVLVDGEHSDWWTERAKALRTATNRPIRRIRIPRETAVYGREKELAKLRDHYAHAKNGEGQVVLIEGEAGIGKSRLVDEFVARLGAEGDDVHFLFGSYPPGGAATASGALSTAFREHFGEAGSARYLTQIPLLAPAFDAVLRGEPCPANGVEFSRDSLATCFAHATRGLADERPTVVLIDDLHFAPKEGLALFTSIALAIPSHRVVLIGTMRPGVSGEWQSQVTRLDHAERIELARLGPKDLMEVLADSFSSDELAHEVAGQVAIKSDGNPFFVFEIIRGLREGQFITQRDDGTWVSTRVIGEIQIPSSVLDLVNARVAGLSEEERDLLDAASCCGFEFDPALVAEALGVAVLPTLKRFGQIERQHRLVRASGRRYVFDHHQVQEALYQSIFQQVREHYHAALADALATRAGGASADLEALDGALCVDLCEHYLAGARGGDALRYLRRAQTHLSDGYLHAQSADLGERALAVPGLLTGAVRVETLIRNGDSHQLVGRQPEWRRAVEEAVRLADAEGDTGLRARAQRELGHLLEQVYDNDAATRALGVSRALAREAGDVRTEAHALCCLGMVLKNTGRLDEARSVGEEHLRLARELGDRSDEALALGRLGEVFRLQGRFDEARELHRRHLAVGRETGFKRAEALASLNLGVVCHELGLFAESREHFERALGIAREMGNRRTESYAMTNLGLALGAESRIDEQREWLERSLALTREIGDRISEAICLLNLGATWAELGLRARAREALETAVSRARDLGARDQHAYGLLQLGRLSDEEGDTPRALDLVGRALEIRRATGNGRGVADTLFQLADVRRRAGDAEGARAAVEESLALCREQGNPSRIAHAEALLACVRAGAPPTPHAAQRVDDERGAPRLHSLLHQATGDSRHLADAKRALDDLLAKVPPEYHESMCTNVRVNREILTAWREQFGEDDETPGEGSPGQ